MTKNLYSLILSVFFILGFSKLGFAQDINDVASSMVDSASSLPGFVAGLAYLGGLIVGVTAIFKLVDHVNNPTQTPLSVPVIRLLIAGSLFGLPIFAEAVWVTINGAGAETNFDAGANSLTSPMNIFFAAPAFVSLAAGLDANWNAMMGHILAAVDEIPGLVGAVGYLLGLVIMVSALYKTRDHVENPSQVPLKDAVIRFIIAGALFALPTVFEAMYETVSETGLGIWGTVVSVAGALSFFYSTETSQPECLAAIAGVGTTLGDVICKSMVNSFALPVFLNAISYLIGLTFGLWGVLKVRDHVLEPQRVQLHEGVSRLIAGGAFFSLPYMVTVFKMSFLSAGLVAATPLTTNTAFKSTVVAGSCGTTNSLDEAMGCFMLNIMGPAHVALNFFAFVAGMIFIMIGISRLIKTSQEGARGPGGAGTIGTFIIGGMLLSASTILRAFSASMFDSTVTYTYANLQFTGGMATTETDAAHNVISAVLQFMIVLGMISFVRGMFIMRDVAEGKGQASTMAGITHLLGGALAVNLGPLLNAIQQTLGITAFGVTFGAP